MELEPTGEPVLHFIDAAADLGISFPFRTDFSSVRNERLVVVGPHEVANLVGQMPLLLKRTDESWLLVAAMGLLGHGNQVIGPQGGWHGAYVPDNLRLHPLVVRRQHADAEVQIAVRHGFSLQPAEGERQLVGAHGGYTELYHNLLQRLVLYEQQQVALQGTADALMAAGLLEELTGENLLVRVGHDFYASNMAKLHELAAPALEPLAQSGALALGYAMHYSAANLNRYLQLLQRPVDNSLAQEVGSALQYDNEPGFNFD